MTAVYHALSCYIAVQRQWSLAGFASVCARTVFQAPAQSWRLQVTPLLSELYLGMVMQLPVVPERDLLDPVSARSALPGELSCGLYMMTRFRKQ